MADIDPAPPWQDPGLHPAADCNELGRMGFVPLDGSCVRGIYALIAEDGYCEYIGMSTRSIHGRLFRHEKRGIQWARTLVLDMSRKIQDQSIREMESFLIKRFHPEWNDQGSPFNKTVGRMFSGCHASAVALSHPEEGLGVWLFDDRHKRSILLSALAAESSCDLINWTSHLYESLWRSCELFSESRSPTPSIIGGSLSAVHAKIFDLWLSLPDEFAWRIPVPGSVLGYPRARGADKWIERTHWPAVRARPGWEARIKRMRAARRRAERIVADSPWLTQSFDGKAGAS